MKIIGHRGYISEQSGKDFAYQNSLSAFRNALEYGDGFETDACLSADGEIFLVHEAKFITPPVEYVLREHLDEKSQAIVNNHRLDEMTAAEIKSLRLISGECIPTLQEALTLASVYPDKIINIELKGHDTGHAVKKQLQRTLAYTDLEAENFLISSFNHEAIFSLKKLIPFSKGLIFSLHEQARTPIFSWVEESTACYEPFRFERLEQYKNDGHTVDYIILGEPDLTLDNIAAIKTVMPDVKIGSWVFTELNPDIEQFYKKIEELAPKNIIDVLIVDNTKEVRERLKSVLRD